MDFWSVKNQSLDRDLLYISLVRKFMAGQSSQKKCMLKYFLHYCETLMLNMLY